ncbi:MAG: hypothetical protein K9I34_07015 [Bacteroidales bacterium]|nr:hypothetical protein [Bacteroidales bacterium]
MKNLQRTRFLLLLISIMLPFNQLDAQFAPPAGMAGSTAIAADSSLIISWADSCRLVRGPMDISQPALGEASYGASENALGPADNLVVSLGDGGWMDFIFPIPVSNHPGPDFAIFENSFSDYFLELGFVEVSSDLENFFRFPATSLTQSTVQIQSFGTIQPEEVNNLAGKYRGGFGTPFNLEELDGIAGLDINQIRAIRLIDVIGSIDSVYASYDASGNMVNDPWPTAFESSGFDLDALAILGEYNRAESLQPIEVRVFPQPADNRVYLHLASEIHPTWNIKLFNSVGQEMPIPEPTRQGNEIELETANLKIGLYLLQLENGADYFITPLHIAR